MNRLIGNGYSSQGSNFGIGLPSPADTGNIVEENTAVGNMNGLFVGAGVKGNILRRNIALGNPGIQISLDHPSANGYDIQNLSTAGANSFEGNTCISSLNAPCPSTGPTFTASPNPIPVAASASLGMTTLSWNAPDAQFIEIHIGSPTGPVFAFSANRGSVQTGFWVTDGMTFYLQDVSNGNPLTADYTLGKVVVNLQKP